MDWKIVVLDDEGQISVQELNARLCGWGQPHLDYFTAELAAKLA
ncbi:MAG: hypothetical protein ACJ8CN_01995 [Gemmatimonadales bacterium]